MILILAENDRYVYCNVDLGVIKAALNELMGVMNRSLIYDKSTVL